MNWQVQLTSMLDHMEEYMIVATDLDYIESILLRTLQHIGVSTSQVHMYRFRIGVNLSRDASCHCCEAVNTAYKHA